MWEAILHIWETILPLLPLFGLILGLAMLLSTISIALGDSLNKVKGISPEISQRAGFVPLTIGFYAILGGFLWSMYYSIESILFGLLIGGVAGGCTSIITFRGRESGWKPDDISVTAGVIAGGVAGVIAGGVAGGYAGGFAGGIAGGIAGRIAGKIAGEIDGVIIGGFAGGIAGGFAGGFAGVIICVIVCVIDGVSVGVSVGVIIGMIASITILFSKPFYIFLYPILILLIYRGAICKSCLQHSVPLRSRYDSGKRYCEHCKSTIFKWNIEEKVIDFIESLRDKDRDRQKSAAIALSKITNPKVNKLILLTISYPNLLCEKCYLRAKKKGIRIGMFKTYAYVFCRMCGRSTFLITEIEEVVGLIGGDVKDYKRDGKVFYINLWDEENRKSRNADIDKLMIINTDGIPYDWAIASVTTTLKNDVSRPRDWLKTIPVILKGEPNIPEDSLSELKRICKIVQV